MFYGYIAKFELPQSYNCTYLQLTPLLCIILLVDNILNAYKLYTKTAAEHGSLILSTTEVCPLGGNVYHIHHTHTHYTLHICVLFELCLAAVIVNTTE